MGMIRVPIQLVFSALGEFPKKFGRAIANYLNGELSLDPY
jgi:hypothetical protein